MFGNGGTDDPAASGGSIFVSYRRDDSADVIGRTLDRLYTSIDDREVFRDIDDIPLGVDFKDYIDKAISQAAVLLVAIGPRWTTASTEEGKRRLEDPHDFVRLEVEAALDRGIPVVPLLVGGATMPRASDLPESIRPLAFRNGIRIRPDPDFDHDVGRLIEGLERSPTGSRFVESVELETKASKAETEGDWAGAQSALLRLVELEPEREGLAARLAIAESRGTVASLEAKLANAAREGRWSDVLSMSQGIRADDQDWSDSLRFETTARAHLTFEEARSLRDAGELQTARSTINALLAQEADFPGATELAAKIDSALQARRRRILGIGVAAAAMLVVLVVSILALTRDDNPARPSESVATTQVPPSRGTTTQPTGRVDGTDEQLSGMTMLGENTFTLGLKVADPEFPQKMWHPAYFPMPDAAFEDPSAFERAPIGNGPFMMDGVWEHNERIAMTIYPGYAGPDRPRIEKLQFMIIPDEATAYSEAMTGGIDVLDRVPTGKLSTYQDDFPDSNAEFLTGGSNSIGFPAYLTQFTRDHRQALSMAIDRSEITEEVLGAGFGPASSVIPPSLQGRDSVCESWSFNPEKAKDLWDAAGDPGPIMVWFNSGAGHEAWVEAVANMWSENLGIESSSVSLESVRLPEYDSMAENRQVTGPFRLGWRMDYPSPFNALEPLYASHNVPPKGSNNTFYNNPEFDQALADGQAKVAETGMLDEGIEDYYRAEDILCRDAQVAPVHWAQVASVWNVRTASNVFIDAFGDLGYSSVESTTGGIKTRIVEPEHLVPTNSNESEGIAVLRALFRGLVNLDAETNETYNAHAESITSDDGGKTWTIVLKPGWAFHDGTPVTAESYVKAWSYGASGANAQKNNSFYANIIGYDELNPSG